MAQIEGMFRAWSDASGNISLVLDLGSASQTRFDLEPVLNHAELWTWLDGRVRPPKLSDEDKPKLPPSDAYVAKSGPKPKPKADNGKAPLADEKAGGDTKPEAGAAEKPEAAAEKPEAVAAEKPEAAAAEKSDLEAADKPEADGAAKPAAEAAEKLEQADKPEAAALPVSGQQVAADKAERPEAGKPEKAADEPLEDEGEAGAILAAEPIRDGRGEVVAAAEAEEPAE